MHVSGVDVRHHKRSRPRCQIIVVERLVARRLLWALKARRQRERISQQRHQTEVVGRGRENRFHACRGAARQRALHDADPSLDPADRRTQQLFRGLLAKENPEFERDRIVAAGKQDAGAGVFCRGLMRIDHLAHPDRFAAEVEVVGAGGGAGCDQVRTVVLIGTDRRQHQISLVDHRRQRRWIAGVGLDQGGIGRRTDRIAHRGQLVEAASGHRPFRSAATGIMRRQIFGDELPGEAG